MNETEGGTLTCVYHTSLSLYPSRAAHHSCEADGQDSAARADVQSFGSLVQLVVKKLEGVGVLDKAKGVKEKRVLSTISQ